MLLDNFYKHTITSTEDDKIFFDIEINKDHKIFEGHFPQLPIVPGVCQVLMVREIICDYLSSNMQLWSARSIKFLSMLNPVENNKLQGSISYKNEDGVIKVNAILHANDTNYLKLKGAFGDRK